MLAFVFAVISLSSIAPDPIVTPAAAIHDRITAGTGFASQDPASPSGLTSDITVAPACTFGAPQFGNSFWSDAASFARLTQPSCTLPGSSAPWLPAFGNGFVQLEPATLRSGAIGRATTFIAPLPARFTALPAPLSHVSNAPVLRARAGVEPIDARAASGAPRITERHH